MRYIEIASGLRLPVSGEEQEIIDKIGSSQLVPDDLDEREREVARLMVSKGLLYRTAKEGKVYLSVATTADIWRF